MRCEGLDGTANWTRCGPIACRDSYRRYCVGRIPANRGVDDVFSRQIIGAGNDRRYCRGETVRKLVDRLIAASAIRESVPVLHDDVDFEVLARHTDLRIYGL